MSQNEIAISVQGLKESYKNVPMLEGVDFQVSACLARTDSRARNRRVCRNPINKRKAISSKTKAQAVCLLIISSTFFYKCSFHSCYYLQWALNNMG